MQSPKDRDLLKKRAQALAQPLATEEAAANFMEILLFRLAEEQYGIETLYIKEVFPLKNYTPLPSSPSFIYGVTNIRRKIVTIVDLKELYELPKNNDKHKSLVILGEEDIEYALLIDSFKSIKKVPHNALQASLFGLTGVRQEFLKGLLVDGTVILDGKKLIQNNLISSFDRTE